MRTGELSEQRPTDLSSLLRSVDGSPASYLSAARTVEAETTFPLDPLSIGFVSTFTFDLLSPYLVVEGARRGLRISPFFAPFNQLEQQLLDPRSALYLSKPDLVVIASRLEELSPTLVHRFSTLSAADVEAEIDAVVTRLQNLIHQVRSITSVPLFLFNQTEPLRLSASLADAHLFLPQRTAVHQINEKLAGISRQTADVFIFDHARLMTEVGLNAHDEKLWYMGRIPFGATAQREIGKRLARYCRALRRPPCKCLVLDLDNTLWGGVLGEDGIGGVKCGEDYPGRMFKDFQRVLLSLRDRGILLAIASKNNEAEVLEVFNRNGEFVLKWDDFSARQIHWNDKATSLAAIAKALNIGTDALAFFDDQPLEREWIRSRMPEVTVIDVPPSALHYTQALDESGAFDQLVISEDDRKRASSYRIDGERRELENRSVSIEEFLKQLQVVVHVGAVDQETLPRVVQLISKTNQFNLTTRRTTASELDQMMKAGTEVLWVRAEDRFGDYGLVGVAAAVPDGSTSGRQWKIDLFLLSCRALGRQVETAFLSALSRHLRSKGAQTLIGEFISTAKNAPASDFYRKTGFCSMDPEGRIWSWDLSKAEVPMPDFVTVRFQSAQNPG